MNEQAVALKEWAVAVKALAEGTQILLMRKGGIAEETKDFRLQSRSFYLYPTFEHQKEELIKDAYKPSLIETMNIWTPDDKTVEIACRAEVAWDLELRSQEELEKLRDYHIWTDRLAEDRLKWKKKNPLHVLLLRVYRLAEPVRIPTRESYGGCRSWIRLSADLGDDRGSAVLDDETFAEKAARIRAALGMTD